MEALLLIDLQNDFLPGGALAVPGGDQVIQVANHLLTAGQDQFQYAIASQDWHPMGHGSFASQYPGKKPGQTLILSGIQQNLWPDHCVQNSFGSEFSRDLRINLIDAVFQKGTNPAVDSYSAFFDNRSQFEQDLAGGACRSGDTGLHGWLTARNIKCLTVLGLATDYCVLFTVIDACKLGYSVQVVVDGCRAVNVNVGDEKRAFEAMLSAGARLSTSDKIIKKK